MANYSYGGLIVNVTADTRSMTRAIAQSAMSAGDAAAKTLGSALAGATKALATGAGVGVGAVTAFGVASFKTAARVGEMNATLAALAKANHLSLPAVQGNVTAIRKQGIEAGVAQSTVAQFAQQHLDLAKSTDLARVAQDAAVISGQNSSDVLDQLIHGITTQQTDVLRQAGIQVDANRAQADYAKQLHTTVSALTPAQKSQAMLNAVLTQGKTITGAYSAAMEEPGKVLRSFPRLINDIQVSVGTGLVQAFGPAILGAYHFTKALDGALAPGGSLAPILTAIGQAASSMVAPLTSMITKWTGWVTKLKPGQITGITNAIKSFAPEIAAVATALGTFAGGQFTSKIPVIGSMLGELGGPIGAVVAGFGMLAATSPEVRTAMGGLVTQLSGALMPLLKSVAPVVTALATQLGPVLGQVIGALAPVLGALIRTLSGVLMPVIKSLAPMFGTLTPVIVLLVNVLAGGLLQVFAQLAPVLAKIAGQFSGVVVQVVAQLLPVIVQLAPLVGILAQALGTLLVSALQALAPLLPYVPVVLGAVLDVLIPLIPLVTLLCQWLAQLAPILGPLIVAWIALDAVMALNPFGLIVLGLIALATAIKLAYDHFAWFRTAVAVVWGGIVAAFNWFLGVVQAVFGWVTRNWPLLLGILTGPIGLAVVLLTTHFAQVKAVVTGAINTVKAVISGGMNFAKAVISAATSAIMTAFSASMNFVKGVVLGAFNFLRSVISGAMGAARSTVASAVAAIRSVIGGLPGFIRGALSSLGRIFTGAFNAAKNGAIAVMRSLAGTVGQVLGQMVHNAATAGGAVITGLKNGVLGAIKGIGGWVKAQIVDPIVGAVKHFFGIHSPSTVMAGIGGNLIAGLMKGAVLKPLDMAKHIFGGLPQALGSLVTKGMVDIAKLPGKALSALGGVAGKIGGFLGGLFGHGGGPTVSGATGSYANIMRAVLASFGHPELFDTFMHQMMTESGGNANAINLWDSNAKAGHPSQGLMQVIPSTFAAYAGPYRGRGILDPLANIYAAVNYALSRYGSRIGAVLGHGHGYAKGGVLTEPVTGFGHRTGQAYFLAENGPERVSPLVGGYTAAERALMAQRGGRASGAVINVYPREGQSELEIAAAVSRSLAWAQAGGAS